MKTKERPILFNSDMVRAILAGKKTQTRRPIKPQPLGYTGRRYIVPDHAPKAWHESGNFAGLCPHGVVGDVLWVRETWRTEELPNGEDGVRFAAGDVLVPIANNGFKWRPSIHMPRWAARIFLRVTDVRVQRIQDITEEDAMAEGTQEPSLVKTLGGFDVTERRVFARLWSSVYGASSWERNEWVWALTFARIA